MKACRRAWAEQHSDGTARGSERVKYRLNCAFYCVSNQQKCFLRLVIFFDKFTTAVLDNKVQALRRRIGKEF